MPLMFLILGRIVGDLTGYFTPGSKVTKERFMHAVETNAYVQSFARALRYSVSLFISKDDN
jgi:hypothetical protein